MNSNTDLETLIQNQYLEFSIDLESEQPKILVVTLWYMHSAFNCFLKNALHKEILFFFKGNQLLLQPSMKEGSFSLDYPEIRFLLSWPVTFTSYQLWIKWRETRLQNERW